MFQSFQDICSPYLKFLFPFHVNSRLASNQYTSQAQPTQFTFRHHASHGTVLAAFPECVIGDPVVLFFKHKVNYDLLEPLITSDDFRDTTHSLANLLTSRSDTVWESTLLTKSQIRAGQGWMVPSKMTLKAVYLWRCTAFGTDWLRYYYKRTEHPFPHLSLLCAELNVNWGKKIEKKEFYHIGYFFFLRSLDFYKFI